MDCPTHDEDMASPGRDIAFELPDVLFAMSEDECEVRAVTSEDLCALDDERFFIRGVLEVALLDEPDSKFGWGFWAEVSEADFRNYEEHFNDDGHDAPSFRGTLANQPPGYPPSVGAPLSIQLRGATERPAFTALDDAHPLGREQADGITAERLGEIFSDAGLGADPDRPSKVFKIDPSEIRDLAVGRGGCYATDRIMVDGEKVGFMYREQPDFEEDSGWRFVAGDESDDYMDDAQNLGLYDVNILANYDPDIIPLLDTPPDCAFVRDPATGAFVPDQA